MRCFKVILCFLLIFTMCACTKSQFMDLSGFIYRYNKISDNKAELTDFYFDESDTSYVLIRDKVLLRLIAGGDGRIKECRLTLAKATSDKEMSENIISFRQAASKAMQSFCEYPQDTAEGILGDFCLYQDESFLKEGELTKKQGNFYFVFYSTSVACQLRICNLYLTEIEPTKKPD